MQLSDSEKRWLEINFFLLCRKIYNNREEYSDLEHFFRAFAWTNLFECAILIKALNDTCILYNPELQPSKHEFLISLDLKDCRFKYTNEALYELAAPLGYSYSRSKRYKAKMKEEVAETKTILYPKFTTKQFHETYYSFLLTLQYFGVLFSKHIKL